MKKKIKYLIYISLILSISFILFFVYETFFKRDKVIYLTEEKYKTDIENATNEEVFPIFSTDINMVIEEDQKFLNKNFMNLDYDANLNENIRFKMFLPIFFRNCDCIVFNNEDPFKYTNENIVMAVSLENNKLNVSGQIYVYNTTLEVDNNAINNFYIDNVLKSKLIKNKINYFVNGFINDALSINQDNGEVTRSTVVRSSSLYYILTFTFKNFYHYMQHAKDVSIIFDSFHPKNFSKKMTNIDLELIKIRNYDLLYPKNWNVENEYDKKNKSLKISINPKDYSAIIDIYVLEDTNKTSKELSEKYLNIIKNEYIFDGIDFENASYNKSNGSYLFFLKNPKTKNGIPLTIYVKIEGKGNKKLISILTTSRNEKVSYLKYKEHERIFEIALSTVSLRLFGNVDIHNTDWIKLYKNN